MSQPEITWRTNDSSAGKTGSINQLFASAWGSVAGANLQCGSNGWGPTVPLVTDSDGATVTFDLNLKNEHLVVLGGSRTLALANPSIGQKFTILLQQGGSGTNLVTWFSTIRWSGATPPTLTTTVGQIDAFEFLCIASGSYISTWQTLNL
jgi:hypothetical protein